MSMLRFVAPFAGFLLLSTALLPPFAIAETITETNPSSRSVSQNDAYATLRSFLKAHDWQAADQETRRLLEQWVHPNQDIFGAPLASDIPADVLQTLDQLWVEASNGWFGFGVQQRIWQEATAQHPNDTSAAVEAFGRRVGWLRPSYDNNNFVSPKWLTEPELSNSPNIPIGHFPWAGISWERIQNLLNQQSCGSCMIDAMYLQGDRFNRYVPVLYDRVRVVLATSTQTEAQTFSPVSSYAPQVRQLLIPESN